MSPVQPEASTLGAMLDAARLPVAQATQATCVWRACGVRDVESDSRRVQPGMVFLALPAARDADGVRHGARFVAEAIAKGAGAVLCDAEDFALARDQMPADADVPLLGIAGLADGLTSLFDVLIGSQLFGHRDAPDAPGARADEGRRPLIAVTGTDGKTTTVNWTAALLDAALDAERRARRGVSAGVAAGGDATWIVGTLGAGPAARVRTMVEGLATPPLTTPDRVSLHRLLRAATLAEAPAVVMEASSHALDQWRLAGVCPSVAVLTQLGHDHLDYHGSLEAYADAKARLFREHAKGSSWVLNLRDALGRRLWREWLAQRGWRPRAMRWGYRVVADGEPPGADCDPAPHSALLELSNVETTPRGLRFAVALSVADAGSWRPVASTTGNGLPTVELPAFGRFQAENAAAALAAALAEATHRSGFEVGVAQLPVLLEALRDVPAVPGRMERFDVAGVQVVVDYAHTPGALAAALTTLRAHLRPATASLVCVFGCGGDRDPAKRPLMGAVAARLADVVIVTDDNPRSEPPEAIRAAILAGARGESERRARSIEEIADRRAAIAHAVAGARSGDVVLVAGKGHETGQWVAGERRDHSDRAVARELVQRFGGSRGDCAHGVLCRAWPDRPTRAERAA